MEIRRVDDYMPALKERFPTVCEEDLKKIVNHGLRSLYRLLLQGADVFIKSNEYTALFGRKNDDVAYKVKKLRAKWRIQQKLKEKKTPWDGYYYFASKDKDNFDTITHAFYVQREVTIQHTYPYVYRVKIPYCGWEKWELTEEELATAEFVEMNKCFYKPCNEKGDR